MDVMIRLLLVVGVVVLFGYIIMYNKKVLSLLGSSKKKTSGVYYRLLGRRLHAANLKMERVSSVNKQSKVYKANSFFKEIIDNLDMAKDNVTPVGLITFISCISLALAIVLVTLLDSFILLLPAFGAVFYLVVIIFRFISLLRYEKREAEIMDAVDLLVSDIKGGVQNAISRYRNSFHPNIKPYFETFLDDIQNKGYGFKTAIISLNDKLGANFNEFAEKAIMYEEKADKDMEDIFSSIIEINRYRRSLRHINNQEFNKLRTEFLVSMLLIAGYGLFSMSIDPFIANFFTHSTFGKLLLLVDIVTIAAVLGYLASIKAKSL